MQLSLIDIIIFFAFVAAVVGIGVFKSRHEKDSESYFLAGRGLTWWLIGFSLIAANISTEQFVGMSGQAADYVGLAIASYEWMAAITLVVVAFVFLPKFLKTGIYTIPEFLRYRYNETSRSIMAFFTMLIYVFVTIAAVIYSGALTIDTLFHGQTVLGMPINVVTGSWIIGFVAAAYVASGGLKACAWADLLQGSALIIGGAIITWLAFKTLGNTPLAELASATPEAKETLTDASSGTAKFFALNSDKLHMILPRKDLVLPWTALMVGLWIPNFYYWGLNQYITQRTLGASSLGEGQKGIVFAAALKLIIPFVIVFPGIIAFNLYSGNMAENAAVANDPVIEEFNAAQATPELDMTKFVYNDNWAELHPQMAAQIDSHNSKVEEAAAASGAQIEKAQELVGYQYDTAFGLLISRLVPGGIGLQGFIMAAILGAVVSSLASMLNSASTIFTMDIYKNYISKNASQGSLVAVGRICVGVFVVIGCLISPQLANPKFKGVFTYIQEFQGFISPGILAVFVFGFLVRKAPPICGVVGLIVNPVMYGILKFLMPGLAFLDRMAVSFVSVLILMWIITLIKPLPQPIELPNRATIELKPSKPAKVFGIGVVIATLILYAIFW